jgi:pre-mRNA-processing factor 6
MGDRWAPKKPNFGPPPTGYVPGLGRGAIGFITRSDLGPSRIPEAKNINANEVDEANYPEGKFDSWEGEKGALFSKGNLDDEDKQAEEAYDFCEKRVWERGEKKRN